MPRTTFALTDPERAYLYRRRLSATQRQMHVAFGENWGRIERNEATASDRTRAKLAAMPPPHTGELCSILRRRQGLTLNQLATELHCSHVTLIAKEFYGGESAAPVLAYLQQRINNNA